jgi:hypothetical protein
MSRERERIAIDEEEFGDQTGDGPWEWEGQTYTKVTEMPDNACDGQCTRVICKRESDGKYFKFTWMLSFSQNYYMDDEIIEVFPKQIVTVEYE